MLSWALRPSYGRREVDQYCFNRIACTRAFCQFPDKSVEAFWHRNVQLRQTFFLGQITRFFNALGGGTAGLFRRVG